METILYAQAKSNMYFLTYYCFIEKKNTFIYKSYYFLKSHIVIIFKSNYQDRFLSTTNISLLIRMHKQFIPQTHKKYKTKLNYMILSNKDLFKNSILKNKIVF
jgi:hypothetical protein